VSAAKVPHNPTRCIHDTTPDKCCVGNSYVRWLIADEERLRHAQANPEAARREFWRGTQNEDRITA
jgi:hypothetical protein